MNARQRALYRDTCVIYKPVNTNGMTSIGSTKDALYTILESGVACKYFPNSEMSQLLPIGRMPSGSKAELEAFHFEADQEINDTYVVKLTTTGHPDINHCFMVVGEPERRPSSGNRKSNYVHATVRRQIAEPALAV